LSGGTIIISENAISNDPKFEIFLTFGIGSKIILLLDLDFELRIA
jgi:hypothetical protein